MKTSSEILTTEVLRSRRLSLPSPFRHLTLTLASQSRDLEFPSAWEQPWIKEEWPSRFRSILSYPIDTQVVKHMH